MKNIYNITIEQLILSWSFVMLVVFLLYRHFDEYCYVSDISCENGGSIFPIIILSFLIIFYTLGWRNFKKQKNK